MARSARIVKGATESATPTFARSVSSAAPGVVVTTSQLPPIRAHVLSQADLDEMKAGERDRLELFGWAMFSAMTGALPSAAHVVFDAYFLPSSRGLAPYQFVEVLIPVVSATLALMALIIVKGRGKRGLTKYEEIMSRAQTPATYKPTND